QAGDEGAGVQTCPVGRLPPLVLVQAIQLGAGLELVEGPVEVQVREDPPRFLTFVGASDQNGVDVHADELQPVEVVEYSGHRQREHTLSGESGGGDAAGRLQLVRVELDSHRTKL